MRIMPVIPTNQLDKKNRPAFGLTVKDCGNYLKPDQEIKYITKLAEDVEKGVFSKLISQNPISLVVANPKETKQLIIVGKVNNYEQVLYSDFEAGADEFGSWRTEPSAFDPPEIKKYIIKMIERLEANVADLSKKTNESKILPFKQLQ